MGWGSIQNIVKTRQCRSNLILDAPGMRTRRDVFAPMVRLSVVSEGGGWIFVMKHMNLNHKCEFVIEPHLNFSEPCSGITSIGDHVCCWRLSINLRVYCHNSLP